MDCVSYITLLPESCKEKALECLQENVIDVHFMTIMTILCFLIGVFVALNACCHYFETKTVAPTNENTSETRLPESRIKVFFNHF